MSKVIRIVFNESDDAIKKGNFFEKLIAEVFSNQRYTIRERVNYTGMEIDLIAEHKDRIHEQIYIECKAKNRLESKDIKSFFFNAKFKKAKYGYFLSTVDFEHQVAGLIDEIKENKEYDGLYFWGPEKIIELLEETGLILKNHNTYSNLGYITTKEILLYSYFGIYWINLLRKGTIADSFTVIDAKKHNNRVDDGLVEKIINYIDELKDCKYLSYDNDSTLYKEEPDIGFKDTIAELKESKEWFDYLPASNKHFVGKGEQISAINNFFDDVRNSRTQYRAFYIHGKSGWGKSSLIASIRGKSRNKFLRKKQFVYAVDARSISTINFVAISFLKMLQKASDKRFIPKDIVSQVKITSNYDILESDSVKSLLSWLKENNKVLILVFDQFEDVFKKPGLFKVFHKLLMDVNDKQSNLLIGFSWKTEINIPINHEAYHLWQVSKNIAYCIEMRTFNSKEVNAVIKQLEGSLNVKKLDISLKRRIIESSQGFPWLTKKICIHIYQQLQNGNSQEKLIEDGLNIKELFDKDLEGLSVDEIKSLKYIAKRAYDGDIFDAMEIDEKIDDNMVRMLIDKRLVIQSGTKYNIYWDIFRDYLVTDEVPIIGETYFIRVNVKPCIEVLKLFENNTHYTAEGLIKNYNNKISKGSMINILRELINLGLIAKDKEEYALNTTINGDTEEWLSNYMNNKLKMYLPFIKLQELKDEPIEFDELINILKGIFQGYDFSDKTWDTYGRRLLEWLHFAKLDMPTINQRTDPKYRNWENSNTFTPQRSIESNIKLLKEIIREEIILDHKRHNKNLYDLSGIGLLYYINTDVQLTKEGKKLIKLIDNDKEFYKMFSSMAIKPYKIESAVEVYRENPAVNRREFGKNLKRLLDNINSKNYKIQVENRLYNWSKFIYENLMI